MTIFLVTLPAIPGPDTRHTSERSAQRELRNAARAGLGEGSYMRSITLLA